MAQPFKHPSADRRKQPGQTLRSLSILVLAWTVLQIGGLFSPGLLDDVDSIYIEIAREMLHRQDLVTPYLNGIRFLEKAPLMFWIASGSMSVFGVSDWAARLSLAVAVLALLLSTYALGKYLFGERGGFYAALVFATGVGPYLYTRFFIPDILICLWMTLGVHLFILAVDRAAADDGTHTPRHRVLLPCLAFGGVLACNLLTKGLIGLIFPLGVAALYLLIAKKTSLLRKLHLVPTLGVFLIVAAPWHILAAWRNPAIALPANLGLPPRGGWAWSYFINEHLARFLGRRIPHDYGNTPVWLFWLYAAIWMMPWTTFLPGALRGYWTDWRVAATSSTPAALERQTLPRRDAGLLLTLWAMLVLVFFSVSSRQEYYSLPALPALALMAGGFLARAELQSQEGERARTAALRASAFFLVPLTLLLAAVCAFFALTAPSPIPGIDLASLLSGNPDLYNLSLGHLFDLTGPAMGFFKGPLWMVAAGMLALGPGGYLLRRAGRTYSANLAVAAAMIVLLTAAHEGLRRFYPILGSKELAMAINRVRQPGDLIILDGELASGSSVAFYTQHQVHLIDGRVNALWYGSFWPDAPPVFETEDSLRALWASPRRIFLMTYHETNRTRDLPAAKILARSGGKTILFNH